MYLTSKNSLLYDSKNFDKYSNIYTILIDAEKKYEISNENISKLQSKYIQLTLTLQLYFIFDFYINYDGIYKIVYGHYYNDQNMFLYKKTNKSNIIKHSVSKCYVKELLHNKNNTLICSNTYTNIKKQLDVIIKDDDRNIRQNNKNPLEITYNTEILLIKTNGSFSTRYNEGNLTIIN